MYPRHLLGQDAHAHLLEIIHRVPRGFRIVLHKPFLRAEGSDPLAHVGPPVHEGHVRLGTPTPRPQDMQAPGLQVRFPEQVVVRVPRLILEDGGEGSRNPTWCLVSVPHEALRVQFRRIHHGLALRESHLRLQACGCLAARDPMAVSVLPSRLRLQACG